MCWGRLWKTTRHLEIPLFRTMTEERQFSLKAIQDSLQAEVAWSKEWFHSMVNLFRGSRQNVEGSKGE